MYRKIVWCYVLVLTLMDISLNTKLTAQGKSHDVTVHDSLIEGISFQEWGKDQEGPSVVGGGAAAEALRLAPAALRFGRAALGAAHALTVTLTNTHNATVHLASVAGTTPDFHASFFESKTLPPNGNTSFSVVYLGRREGPVAAHLYIHTSLGVHKYPVSAEGVASEWGVWPLVGLRLPQNATLDPLLTIYNPTDKHIQIREVYSSGGWVGLRLPGGGAAASRAAWRVPPHTSRALVRLRLRLPPPAPHPPHAPHLPQQQRPLTAYIRIKGDMEGCPGGLVVSVEATAAAAGPFLLPPQLRLRRRGSRDPPHTWDISAGNSAGGAVPLEASLWGARCGAAGDAPPPHARPELEAAATANGNGVKSEGAHVTTTRTQLEPHQPPEPALQLTLDYARLWASAASAGAARAEGVWCGGWVRLGAAAMPYSVRLLPGTLAMLPDTIEVVTSNKEESDREHILRVRNEFSQPVLISSIVYGDNVQKYFHTTELTPLVVSAGSTAVVLRLRTRAPPDTLTRVQLQSELVLRTNLTAYTAPLLLHSGTLELEWEWPNSNDGHLRVGGVGASSTRRVGVRVRNPTPAPLCITDHAVRLPHAQLTIDTQKCIPPGSYRMAWLTLVAPARAGAVAGSVSVSTRHAAARAYVTLHVHAGRLHAHPLALHVAAPYAWSAAPLELESTMALSMRVLNVTQPSPDPAVSFVLSGPGWVSGGRQAVGEVQYAPERACAPRCYTGLDLDSPEGLSWLRRGEGSDLDGLRDDVALLRARRNMFARVAEQATNITLYVHTNEVVGIPVSGSVRAHWPRLRAGAGAAAGGGGGGGSLAGVGGAAHARLRLRNPARTPLVLHAAVTPHRPHAPHDLLQPDDADGIEAFCKENTCVWSADAFSVTSWRAVRGDVTPFAGNWSQAFLLAPAAELELTVTFAPTAAAPLAAYLYLRNNLTIVEIVPLWGRGAYPSFELGGRRPGSSTPLVFEVTECPPAGADTAAEGGYVVRRTVTVRNTGAVGVRLREWRVAARACQARGFRVAPCAPLSLAPNETRALRLAYAPDYTLARQDAPLRVRTDLGTVEFTLSGVAAARLLRACQAAAPRPPWEPALRAAGTLLALAALALVLAAGAVDAERELRRARAARAHAHAAPPRRALDLRAVRAPPPPPPPAPAPARRRRQPRRPAPPDAQAERRAFERWRAEVLRRPDDDDDRSSEEADVEPDSNPPSDPIKTESRSASPPTPDGEARARTARGAPASRTGRRWSRRWARTRRAAGRAATTTRSPSRAARRLRRAPPPPRPTPTTRVRGPAARPASRRAGAARSGGRRRAGARARAAGARTCGARRRRGGGARGAGAGPRRAARRRRPSRARRPRCAGAPPGAPWWRRAPRPAPLDPPAATTAAPPRCRRSGRTCGGARRAGRARAWAPWAARTTRCSTSTASSRRPRPRPTRTGARRPSAPPTRRRTRTNTPTRTRTRRTTTTSTSSRTRRVSAAASGRCGRARARGRGAARWCGRRPASTGRRRRRRAPTTRSARWPPSGRPARWTGATRRRPRPPTSRAPPTSSAHASSLDAPASRSVVSLKTE